MLFIGHKIKTNPNQDKKGATDQNKSKNSYEKSNFFSRRLFWFMLPVFKKINANQISNDNIEQYLEDPCSQDRSNVLGSKLEASWLQELEHHPTRPLFLRAILRVFRWQLVGVCASGMFSKSFGFPVQSLILAWLIQDMNAYANRFKPCASVEPFDLDGLETATIERLYWSVWYDAILLMSIYFITIVSSHPHYFGSEHVGMKCRVAANHLIFKKALKLSSSAMSQTTTGQVINLLSNDTVRFDEFCKWICYLIIAPLQAIIIFLLMGSIFIGWTASIVVALIIGLYVLSQPIMAKLMTSMRRCCAKHRDERIKLINELILSIKVIKMYNWQESFEKLVDVSRKKELTYIKQISILSAINNTLTLLSLQIVTFAALVTYTSLGHTLNPEVVFVLITSVSFLRTCLTSFFPQGVSNTAEILVSCDRIQKFLLLDEIDEDGLASDKVRYICRRPLNGFHIKVWRSEELNESNSKPMHTYDLNGSGILRGGVAFNLKERDLLIVVGSVGSGKSYLLMSLLGELPAIGYNRLSINGRISYASQEPWMFSGTIRENILFNQHYIQDRYNKVLDVCSLNHDLQLFPAGDLTIVGERGVSLSGGQRARVNLARALYYDADIYLLDDPLSAIDAPVARHIFNKCSREFLSTKIVVLTTHQLQFLCHASKVLVLSDDRLTPASFGNLQEIAPALSFSALESHSRISTKLIEENSTPPEYTGGIIETTIRTLEEQNRNSKVVGTFDAGFTYDLANELSNRQPITRLDSSINKTISMEKQPVNRGTYWFYLSNSANRFVLACFLVANIVTLALMTLYNFWICAWTDSQQRQAREGVHFVVTTLLDRLNSRGLTLTVYSGLMGLTLTFVLLRAIIWYKNCLQASWRIHKSLFKAIIDSPMDFFDFTPAGTILNRIACDMDKVDELVYKSGIEVMDTLILVLCVICTSVIIQPINLIAVISLLIGCLILLRMSAPTIKRMKQIESVETGKILSHLSTTLSSLVIIRTSKAQRNFINKFQLHQDDHTKAWFTYLCSVKWLKVAMDLLCVAFFCTLLTLLLMTSMDYDELPNTSIVALLVSQCLMMYQPLYRFFIALIELECQMISVEHIKECIELKKSESDELIARHDENQQDSHEITLDNGHYRSYKDRKNILEDCDGMNITEAVKNKQSITRADRNSFCSNSGNIIIRDLTLTYCRSTKPVLKNLNLHIKAGEKIGIVGRTGAGKSSLIGALFRLYTYSGSIEIDGCDTSTRAIGDLRKSISIIPQEPVLLSASVRKNLDPFDEYSDETLWHALESVRMQQTLANQQAVKNPQGLNYVIEEGGRNFSIGQKQLICIARAIVRQNKILILDEATANIDPETDSFIQRTIRKEFDKCTLLIIAHRLATVMDCDKIAVMEEGQVKEFGEPHILLDSMDADSESLLSKLISNGTSEHADRLRQVAKEAYEIRHSPCDFGLV